MEIPYWLFVLMTTIAAIVVVVIGIGAIGVTVDRFNCERSWKDSGREWRFHNGACQIHDGKGWVPAHAVRVP